MSDIKRKVLLESEEEFNKMVASNINNWLLRCGKTQTDLADALGVSTATTTYWCKGIKVPRMDKIDKMCAFFGCRRTDLLTIPVSVSSGSVEGRLLDDFVHLSDANKQVVVNLVKSLREAQEGGGLNE